MCALCNLPPIFFFFSFLLIVWLFLRFLWLAHFHCFVQSDASQSQSRQSTFGSWTNNKKGKSQSRFEVVSFQSFFFFFWLVLFCFVLFCLCICLFCLFVPDRVPHCNFTVLPMCGSTFVFFFFCGKAVGKSHPLFRTVQAGDLKINYESQFEGDIRKGELRANYFHAETPRAEGERAGQRGCRPQGLLKMWWSS